MSDGPLVGRPVRRKEDARFLTGAGSYTDDLRAPGAAHAVVLRSPHPHARIHAVDASAARALPGVLALLSADDVAGDIPGPVPSFNRTPPYVVPNRDGAPVPEASQYPLARDKVRYLGEPVAFVVAETLAQARDAAEAVVVDYEPLPAVTDYAAAVAPGAPRVWDELPGNASFDWEHGERAAVEAAFAAAGHVVQRRLVNNRVVAAFMEPRAAIASYDAASGRYTLQAGSQSAHRIQAILAGMLGVERERLRVLVPDTGGGFGARGVVYPEFPLLLVAARRLGRVVRWTAERGESFLSDTQARDQVLHGELALDRDGRFTALRVALEWRHGAYVPSRGMWVLTTFMPPTLGGVYTIPACHLRMRGAFTNTTPQTAYRGVGRVEATYLIESLVDAAAAELCLDRVELRRRNMVVPRQMPWRAAGGAVYHSGDFPHVMQRAVALADWEGFAARRAHSAARGRLRGIGLAMYVENDGGAPAEFAEVEAVAPDGDPTTGEVLVYSGTQNFGMGHETFFAQVLADELGVPFERIRLVDGDTERVREGFGSHGSRSARIGGGAAVFGAREMVEHGRALAGELLEAAVADIEYAHGRYTIAGTDRGASLFEVAAYAAAGGRRLAGAHDFVTQRETHANGCQICEVEVDLDTGAVAIVRYTVVADAGRVVNPMIVEGQLHGAVAQGTGQALLERVVYDDATGQTLTGSFMDYAIPRAGDLPAMATALHEVPESDNPLGIKGVGEGGTTGAPAAVMNAVRDAIGDTAGILDMPATPLRVWSALRALRSPTHPGAARRDRPEPGGTKETSK